MRTGQDRTSQAYWDGLWKDHGLPAPILPESRELADFPVMSLLSILRGALPAAKSRLLEIGCASSPWLPVFSRQFGYEVVGLDYSEAGCESARRLLHSQNAPGQIICADLFQPPADLLGAFDIVVSFGVVEHFDPVSRCVQAMAAFLRPSGLMFTQIPNLAGVLGLLQKALDLEVFRKHVPLDARDLGRAHVEAGLRVRSSRYYLSSNFAVCNLNSLPPRTPEWWAKKALLAGLSRLSILGWASERRLGVPRPTRALSPYAICVAEKV